MNHKALAIAPIVAVAALALTAVGFAIPQQAFASYGHHYYHHNHNHHNNNNNHNRIDVSQSINQENNCTFALCTNDAQNQADIHR
jgi:phosphoglucomutase